MGFAILWLFALGLSGVHAGYKWKGLTNYDKKNFLCYHFNPLCENFLDEIGCGTADTDRIMEGCPGFPDVPNDIANYVGKCTCVNPVYYDASGAQVTRELLGNRLLPDMSWMLEPWSTGPPYDIAQSFTGVCQLLLDRIGCPVENQTNSVNVSQVSSTNYKCYCGALTTLSTVTVTNQITDKINIYNLQTLPVFSDPVYLSVAMSMCIVLICGKLGAIVAVYCNLPSIIGFLLAGVGIQNILNPMFLKGAGYPYPSAASEIKNIALVIVLMRAGLSTKLDEIYKSSISSITLSTLPYFGEFFIFLYAGKQVFGWDTIDMGLMASIMAPLGPSVVISGLLTILSDKTKNYGFLPKQLLITTPIEAVIAIILFGVFSTLETTTTPPLYPWVKVYPLYVNCLLIPLNLIFSTVLGIVCGWCVSKYINYRITQKTDYVWVRISRNPQMGSSTADLVFALLVTCYTMMSLCNMQYIQQASGVLVVFVTCITVSRLTHIETAQDIAAGCKGIWIFAEVFLFTLTGVSLSFDSNNGPLYGERGPNPSQVAKIIGMIFIGSCGRIIGIGASLIPIYYTYPEHRRSWRYMVPMWIATWIFQLPKATVQATMGGLAYTQHIIPGPVGLNKGLFIAQSTALTVLIFAPVGTLLTKFVGVPITFYMTRLDTEAKYNIEENRYYTEEEIIAKRIAEDAEMAAKLSAMEKEPPRTEHDNGLATGHSVSNGDHYNNHGNGSIHKQHSSHHGGLSSHGASGGGGGGGGGSSHAGGANSSSHHSGHGGGGGSYRGSEMSVSNYVAQRRNSELSQSGSHMSHNNQFPSTQQIEEDQLQEPPTVVDLINVISTRVRSATMEVSRRRSATMEGAPGGGPDPMGPPSMLDLMRGRRKSRSGVDDSARRPSAYASVNSNFSAHVDDEHHESNSSSSSAGNSPRGVSFAGGAGSSGVTSPQQQEQQQQHQREYELANRSEHLENISTQI